MRILYVAPNINHHQVPLVQEIMAIKGMEVIYAVQLLREEERLNMGWQLYDEPWILEIDKNKEKFQKLFMESDVVICSVRDYHHLMSKRLQNLKLTFYYTERWFKIGIGELGLYIKGISKLRLLHPKFIKIVLGFKKNSKYQNFYLLPQSEYAAKDFKFLGLCKNRIYNWGYFPEVSSHPAVENYFPKGKINIFWCGRFLNWKRVDVLVKAFKIVTLKYSNVHLTLLGQGDCKDEIKTLSEKLLLSESITFMESVSSNKVREIMNKADIYVLPSSGFEGWGAVINEAMAESCVVIGSNMTGAAKTIINDGINGFIFSDGDYKSLASKIEQLLSNKELYNKLLKQSLTDINQLWSPETAAKRLVAFCDANLKGESLPIYESGPLKLLF